MGINKTMISNALDMLRVVVGAKKYYVALGGATMTSLFFGFMFSSIILKIFFFVNTIVLAWVILNDQEGKGFITL